MYNISYNNPSHFVNNLYRLLDEIKINSPDEPGLAKIIAFTDWGMLRGIESFSQLVTAEDTRNGNHLVSLLTHQHIPKIKVF